MILKRVHAVFFVSLFLFTTCLFAVTPKATQKNEEGVRALNSGNNRYAVECLLSALKEAPDNDIIKKNLSNAFHNYGMEFLKRGEILNAIDYFEDSLKYNPNNTAALVNTGRAYYNASKFDKAVYYIEKAYEADPDVPGLKAFLEKIKKEKEVEAGFGNMASSHFVLSSEERINVNDLANIKITLEDAYSRVGTLLDYFPLEKVPVVIYPEPAYKKLTSGKPQWSHALFDGKIRIPMARNMYSKDFLRDTIYHEYAHALVRFIARRNCPLWLNEGIACYSEGLAKAKGPEFFEGYITKGTFVTFDKLPTDYAAIKSSYEANLYYREFYLIAAYIVDKFGTGDLRKVLKELGTGHTVPEALRSVFGCDISSFSDGWKRYVFYKLGIS